MKLFPDEELKTVFNLPKKTLPLNNECLKYVSSWREVKDHHHVVQQLAKAVHELRNKAAVPSMSVQFVECLNQMYGINKNTSKQGAPGRKHHSNKETRMSKRTKKVEKVLEIIIG